MTTDFHVLQGETMSDKEIAICDNWAELVNILQSHGATIVGAADLGQINPDLRQGLPVGISIAAPISVDIVAGIKNGSTKEYYAEYKRLNQLLVTLGIIAADYIKQHGHTAIPVSAANAGFDANTLATQLPHKTVATRAGLGWIGKTALLVTKSFGTAIRLTSVLTDADFPPGGPIDTSQCGDCRACVDICPAHAAVGSDWHIGLERNSFFNAIACRTTARELSAKIGVSESCCGVCIAACPWTRAYIRR
jgi:epoxyqueuosine reductase QueG